MSFARTAPLKPVMIYDGDCGVCEWFASWARRQVPMWRIVAAQRCSDAELTGLGVTRDRCAEAVQVVAHGCVLSGAQAMNALLIAAHHPLGTVARIAAGCAPLLALENRAYRLFARHRATVSRFFGLRSCRIGS